MIKNIRIKRGLSQNDLSQMTGISVRTLQSYEATKNGRKIDGAKLDTLIDLSVALRCPIRDLLDSEDLKKKCETTDL